MTISQGLILFVFALLLIWTANASKFNNPTISMTMRDLGWKYTSFSTLMGILVGHWFFPSVNPAYRRVGNVLPILIVLWLLDLAWARWGDGRQWWRYPGVWFAIGVILGAILWAQRLVGVSLPF